MILIRQALADLRLLDALDNQLIINDALSYFNRQNDHAQVRAKIKQRFGTSVKSVKDPGEGEGVTETYIKGDFDKQVDEDGIENFSIGFGQKVTSARATLFTERSQKFSLVHETVEDVDAAENLLFVQNREASSFASTIVEVNEMAVQVGSAALFPEFARGHLTYKKLSPADITPHFGDYIDEEGKKRAVNPRDIEDATVIVVNLGINNNEKWNYLAIWGRSEIYPNGRNAQFQGEQILTRLPEPYEDDAIEHEIEGQIANPLTWWGNEKINKDKDIPEYPIIVFKGGVTDSNCVMPVYTSLYAAAKEFDISACHTESSGQKGAAGTRVHIPGLTSGNKKIPESLSGDIAANPGDEVKAVEHDSDSVKVAQETTERNMLHCAYGYGVPDYRVVPQKNASLVADSGIALAIKTMPLDERRDYSINLNRPAVKKMFEVEKALIGHHAPSESDAQDADINLLQECEQTWDPGEQKLPENKNELAARLVLAKEKGLIDEIESIRRFNELASDEEAKALYEKMADRADEFPPLVKEEVKKPPLGLKGRTQ